MLARLCLILTLATVLCGCASTPNLMYASHCHSDYTFKKTDKILVALPERPGPDEEKYLPLIREALAKAGLTAVDSVADADRLLTFQVSENTTMTWSTSMIDDRGNPALSPRRTKVDERVDSGYTGISLRMYDVESAKGGKAVIIWEARVAGRGSDFASYADELLEGLAKLYGKNEVREEHFRSKRSGSR